MAITDTIHIDYTLAPDQYVGGSSGTIEVPSWLSADLKLAVSLYFFGYPAPELVQSAELGPADPRVYCVDLPDEPHERSRFCKNPRSV